MLRDILRDEDPQITAISEIIRQVSPDVLVLTDFDWDHDGLALAAFADLLGAPTYPHRYAPRPNSGAPSGFDLDQNGYLGDARDAWGYGRFTGDGGIAVLSHLPFDTAGIQDFTALIWQDMPDATLPVAPDGTPFWPADLTAQLPLSTTAHVILPVVTNAGTIDLMIWSATPPVFDDAEDANGLRNRDELRLWEQQIEQRTRPFIVIGNANLDPADGEGDSAAMAEFLNDPRLQDTGPRSRGGDTSDPTQSGNPAHDTASWPDNPPGNLRVSYVLPSRDLRVTGSGVFWPTPDDAATALLGNDGRLAGPHRLVWVDIDF